MRRITSDKQFAQFLVNTWVLMKARGAKANVLDALIDVAGIDDDKGAKRLVNLVMDWADCHPILYGQQHDEPFELQCREPAHEMASRIILRGLRF